MYQYIFSGGMCWECKSHRPVIAAKANNADWEVTVISFRKNDLLNDTRLRIFLFRLARALHIKFTEEPPRKNPYQSALTRAWFSISDEEYEAAHIVGADAWDTWREDMWWTIESNSIQNNGCILTKESAKGPWLDISIHAPTAVCDAFLGALYDWNHGRDTDEAIRLAPIEAETRLIIKEES